MWPFCKHRWEVKDKTVLPSFLQQQAASGATWKGKFSYGDVIDLSAVTVMVILICQACGKVKTIKSRNPPSPFDTL